MKKYIFLLLVVILTLGCGRPAQQKKEILARINNYEITLEEFQEEFIASGYARVDTLQSKEDFLNSLINRKLILQDAQKKGLDKDKSFLKMIESFWEQSLLKLALDKKTKEIAGSTLVNDKEIEEAYNNLLKDGKTDKTYDQMYQQIKWEVSRNKETQRLNDWIAELRNKADTKINEELLKYN